MKRPFALLLAALGAAPALPAATAYLPAPQTGRFHPVASVQWARDFWFDDNRATLPGHLTQTTAAFEMEYGLAPGLAADATVGYSWVNYQGGPLAGIVLTRDGRNLRRGLADSQLGLSWRLLDEFATFAEAAPTVTVRLGGRIAGDYDTGFLNAISDGAGGWDLGLKLGKVLLAANAGFYGDFTYRWLDTSVPDEWEASFGGFKNVRDFTVSLGLREKQSVGGIDILGPGFSLARFTDVREKNRTLEFGLTWNVRTGSSVSVGYARTLAGENTPKKNVLIFAGSLGF